MAVPDYQGIGESMTKDLVGVVDARVWASEFVKVVEANPDIPTDEGCMIGWFANAIMAGHDSHSDEIDRRRRSIARILG